MKSIKKWLQQEKRYVTLLKAMLLAALPFLCCALRVCMDNETISQVWLPGSEWNDELFYFKQVESILEYGYPYGFFGFNESQARVLSFAAWSPVLVFPWILWGLLFGWNLMSPIWCNITFLAIIFFLYVCLVKPTWKQLGLTALLLCFFTPMWRYALSGMPEVLCMGSVIAFYGVAHWYLKTKKTGALVTMFVLAGLMTLMRPYFLLFLLLPAWLWMKRSRWIGLVGSGLVTALVFGMYLGINRYLGAAYFAPLFFTDWLEAFFTEGIGRGIYVTLGKLYRMGEQFLRFSFEGFRSGLYAGTFFGVFGVSFLVLAVQSIRDYRSFRKKKQEETASALILQGHLLFCFTAMFFAILLMYKLTEGSRHLLTFVAAGIFLIGGMPTVYYKKVTLLGITLAFLFLVKPQDPIVFQIPYGDEAARALFAEEEECFARELVLETKEVPSFDNVVIWVVSDRVDGTEKMVNWQALYGLPAGYGISCCQGAFCLENLEQLQSKYLLTIPGGSLDDALAKLGRRVLVRDERIVLYQLR